MRRIATSRCVTILSCLGRVAFRAACLRPERSLPRCSLRTRSGARHPRHARAPWAHCAWLRVAPLLPSPSLRAVAWSYQVGAGKQTRRSNWKAGVVVGPLARIRDRFSCLHQADLPAALKTQPFVRPAGGWSIVGTPSVPTALRGYGAQERSRDETAPRRAAWRASLDGSEHRGTSHLGLITGDPATSYWRHLHPTRGAPPGNLAGPGEIRWLMDPCACDRRCGRRD